MLLAQRQKTYELYLGKFKFNRLVSSTMALVWKQICSNAVNVSGNNLSITQTLHLIMCNFILPGEGGKLHPAEASCTEIHKMSTFALYQAFYELTPIHICNCDLISNRANPSSTTWQQLTSWNPSDNRFHRQSSGLYEGKGPYFL